jgi:hypothetical protein
MSSEVSMGKGDTPRTVDQSKYAENFKRIFGVCLSKGCIVRHKCNRHSDSPKGKEVYGNMCKGLNYKYFVDKESW